MFRRRYNRWRYLGADSNDCRSLEKDLVCMSLSLPCMGDLPIIGGMFCIATWQEVAAKRSKGVLVVLGSV